MTDREFIVRAICSDHVKKVCPGIHQMLNSSDEESFAIGKDFILIKKEEVLPFVEKEDFIITLNFSGGGDSGGFDDGTTNNRRADEFLVVAHNSTIVNAVEDNIREYDWWNNDGGRVEVEINITTSKAKVTYVIYEDIYGEDEDDYEPYETNEHFYYDTLNLDNDTVRAFFS